MNLMVAAETKSEDYQSQADSSSEYQACLHKISWQSNQKVISGLDQRSELTDQLTNTGISTATPQALAKQSAHKY